MRIAVLSRNPRLYSTSRLVEAGRARGHDVEVLDPLACQVHVAQGSLDVTARGAQLHPFDAVIPRIGASITDYGLAVLGALERSGVASCNRAEAIARSRDKLRALEELANQGIGIPRTALARDPAEMRSVVEALGGLPVIIKLLEGTQGVGVMLADSAESLESTLQTLWNLGQNLLLQEFVAESRGRDIRALVVGEQLVGAMRRTARGREFRSNLHRGGSGRVIELDEVYAATAIAAARAVGLGIAGVDILESSRGPLVVEVNSSPGLRGIERATGIDAAGRIIEHAEGLARAR